MATIRTPDPWPWTDITQTWWAALEQSDGTVYGLARCVPAGDGSVRYEALDRATGEWLPAPEGAGWFSEIGGVTDAQPIDAAQAAAVEAALRAQA